MPFKKGKTGRIKRALKAKEPKLVEGEKRLLALRGPSTSEVVTDVMRDLVIVKKPDAKMLTRKNDIRPFEDVSSLEFLCEKNDAAGFLYVSHNKKRPHNLVLGRTFDNHILDMMEFGVVGYEGLEEVEGPKKLLGAKPSFVFQGDEWDRQPALSKMRNIILDLYGSRNQEKISLRGMDHVITLTAVADASIPGGTTDRPFAGTVHWRVYTMVFKRSGDKVPLVELVPMGPSLDLVLRRTQFASADLEKEALRTPAQLKPKKVKNVRHDEFGEKLGRIHMERQDFGKLELKKSKAVRAERRAAKAAKAGAGDGDVAMGPGAPAPAPAKAGTKRRREEHE